jgi:hypothetical protein
MFDASATSHRMTLRNDTFYPATFQVKKGGVVIARMPAIVHGAAVQIPTSEAYTVVASTVIDGNTYTSAPISFFGAACFVARVLQHGAQSTYQFEMVQAPPRSADHLEFQNTTRAPVTFILSHAGIWLQTVVARDAFDTVSIPLTGGYTVYAVINGITTDLLQTDDPDAVIAARVGLGGAEAGDFELAIV